jgi:serine/threonine protein kinase
MLSHPTLDKLQNLRLNGMYQALIEQMNMADIGELSFEERLGGVVHRDVKPENALLDASGVLKVMDFGIARLAAAAATSGITASGAILGTPAYMAPEQLVGDEVDARADLYALGVVLYECLTGDLPYQANSVVSLIAKALTLQPTPPIAKNPDVPPALSALVMRLLSKTPADRPAHANELLEALAELG